MKKSLLLLFAALIIAAGATAQDYYVAGHNSNGAVIYKNGAPLYTSATYDNYPRVAGSITMDKETGDVYWSMDCFEQNNTSFSNDKKIWSYVYKNGNAYFFGSAYKHRINSIDWNTCSGEHLFAYGSISAGQGEIRQACVYRDNSTTPYLNMGNGTTESEAFAGKKFKTNDNTYLTYSCGYQKNSSGSKEAIVWSADGVLYNLGSGCAKDLDFWRGDIYTLVVPGENSAGSIKVYRNSSLLYTISGSSGHAFSISLFGGDVYVSGWTDSGRRLLWKNGTVLYTIEGDATVLGCMDVSTDGIYAITRQTAPQIFKNGSLIATISDCTYSNEIYVDGKCTEEDIFTLPFHEGFEISDTHWHCWTVNDVDGLENMYYSTWFVRGNGYNGPMVDSHWASHGLGNNQEGWLISPHIFLQYGRDDTYLSFKSRNFSTTTNGTGVYISTTDTQPSSFTKLLDIPDSGNEIVTKYIDLTGYQGQAVYIAFKFSGNNNWDIDDIYIEESWGTCSSYSLPHTETFDSDEHLSTCWYLLDRDHSGGRKCWKFDETEGTLYHVYGQSGIKQYGDAFSPKFYLEPNKYYSLKFKSKTVYTSSDMKSRIFLGVDVTGTPSKDQYTTLIWQDGEFPTEWTEYTVNLPASVAGHNVSFDFEYQGTFAHTWYIDDVTVVEYDGIEEDGESVALSVMPNPANNVIRVNGLKGTEEVNVYNTLGQVVISARLSDGESLNIENLSAGVYMLRSEKNSQVVKFTVK